MKYLYELPDVIKNFIENADCKEIKIGWSNAQVIEITKKEVHYLKIAPQGSLKNEYEHLSWLQGKLLVPQIEFYIINEEAEFLVTKAVEGEMVCSPFYLANPDQGMLVIKEAFDALYQVDIKDCPFKVALDYKLSVAKYNIDNNLLKLENMEPQNRSKFGSFEAIYQYLLDNRFEEELCFSHGDIALPNLFVKDGHFNGFIDMGECGIADKWFDIAIMVRSIIMNYGKDYVPKLFELLNIEPQWHKIDYYILLMDLYL